MKKALAASAAALAAVALTGCQYNFTFTTAKVKSAEVQAKVAAEIKAQSGREAVVTCPHDLPGKLAAEMTCQATINGKSYPVQIKVTNIKGSHIEYSWLLDAGSEPTRTPTTAPTTRTPRPSSPASTRPATPTTGPSNAQPGGDARVSKENLQSEIVSSVKSKTGKDATVRCPRDLPAKVGESTYCTVKIEDQWKSAKIEITRVDGNKVYFTINVT